jgi:hypothetical protein
LALKSTSAATTIETVFRHCGLVVSNGSKRYVLEIVYKGRWLELETP